MVARLLEAEPRKARERGNHSVLLSSGKGCYGWRRHALTWAGDTRGICRRRRARYSPAPTVGETRVATVSSASLAAPLSTAQPVSATVPRLPKPSKAPGLVVHRRREVEASTLLATRIPRSLRQRMRLICADQGRAMQHFITEALREYLHHGTGMSDHNWPVNRDQLLVVAILFALVLTSLVAVLLWTYMETGSEDQQDSSYVMR